MAQTLPIFAEFCKIDEEQQMVFGYASTDKRDKQGEIILKSAMEAALPDYLLWRNIREMHGPSAVGTAEEAKSDGKGLWLGAKIIDDRAWMKVKSKVYKGFSVGGRVTARDPDDRSIITGIELSEISLVDRPANPDAVFQIIKRADGQLRPEPLQKWDCGISEHQHTTKSDAGSCMAHELLKRCHDEVEADVEKGSPDEPRDDHGRWSSGGGGAGGGFIARVSDKAGRKTHETGVHPTREAAAHAAFTAKPNAKTVSTSVATPDGRDYGMNIQFHNRRDIMGKEEDHDNAESLEKGNPNLNNGRFGNHAAAAGEHTATAADHGAQAANARAAEAKHRKLATRARDRGDASALAIHEHLAGASAALALQHDNAAEQHRQLAARHEVAATHKSEKEPMMTTRTVADALQDSTSAVALLASSIDVGKGDADNAADAKHAGTLIETHETMAKDFAKQASAHREAAAKADKKDIDGLVEKALEADLLALHHHKLAKGYADLVAHHVKEGGIEKGEAAKLTEALAKPSDHERLAGAYKSLGDAVKDNEALTKHFAGLVEAHTALAKAADPKAEQADAGGAGEGDDGDEDDKKKAEKVEEAAKAATTKCAKCGASMAKDNEKCQNCGATMKADGPVDAGGVAEYIQRILEKTEDEALKGVLTTALTSLLPNDAAKAAAAEKEKAAIAAKQNEITKQIATLTADRDSAVKQLDIVTSAIKGMAKDMQQSQKRHKASEEFIVALQSQMRTLDSQPQPSRVRGMLTNSVSKAEDTGGGDRDDGDDFTKRLLAVPAGQERANWLLRQGYKRD